MSYRRFLAPLVAATLALVLLPAAARAQSTIAGVVKDTCREGKGLRTGVPLTPARP